MRLHKSIIMCGYYFSHFICNNAYQLYTYITIKTYLDLKHTYKYTVIVTFNMCYLLRNLFYLNAFFFFRKNNQSRTISEFQICRYMNNN